LWLFRQAMRRFKGFDVRSKRQRELREACVAFINRSIDDPATREAVTPRYPWGCKRVVLASNFYSALNSPNVELVPHEVTRVTPTGLVDATGAERPVDVLILSTGFQPTSFLKGIEVKGRDGRGLHDAWQGRPNAFLGITVAGFPNFFILYGPNTNGGGSIIHQLERQAEVAANAVRRLGRGPVLGRPVLGRPVRSIDTRPGAQRRWVAWIDRRLATAASAMDSGCNNYYHVADATAVAQFVDATVERFGRLDGAFNNAAMTQAGRLDEVAEEDFDQIMAVNVKGTWLCIREEVRVMRERGTGSIVNMSSIGGLRGSSGMGAYQATKHAVIGLTRTAAHDFRPLGIRVNVIAPGPTETPMLAQTRLAIPSGVEARIAAARPAHRAAGRVQRPARRRLRRARARAARPFSRPA
jgi:NAD(P)-dependent dehydrogenase (short-subunit alcohol dehydrogenase family)